MQYRIAGEVERVARPLIEEHHAHLLGIVVEFVFTDKISKSKGREVWGRARKVSGLNAFLVFAAHHPTPAKTWASDGDGGQDDFFVIEIPEEVWRRLTHEGRQALVENQLYRLEVETNEETGAVNLAVVGPDVAEFEAVVNRYGAWHEALEDFVNAAEQPSLLDEESSLAQENFVEAGAAR